MSRQRNLADQQDHLSEATWSVLTERGLPGLTIRAVAERAGCTTGLVMHAFPTKEALLLHARDLLHSRTGEQLDAAEASATDPESALLAVLLDALSLDQRSVDESRVWISYLAASLADPALAERHIVRNRSFVERITRLVHACRPAWAADRARLEALSLISLADGANTLSAADPETYSPAVQRQVMTDAVARALESVTSGQQSSERAEHSGQHPADDAGDRTSGNSSDGAADRTSWHATDDLAEGAALWIRSFRPADTDAVVALWEACGLVRPWNDPRKDIARKLTTQPELFLVAESVESATLLGTAMVGYDGHRGWVNYLAVAPEAQGRGIGRALMDEAEVLLRERGCPKLNLQIRHDNETATEFYRALGYQEDATRSLGKRLIPD